MGKRKNEQLYGQLPLIEMSDAPNENLLFSTFRNALSKHFSSKHSRLSPEHKMIALRILEYLYFHDKHGLNISETYSIFNNRFNDSVRETISQIRTYGYINPIDPDKKECHQEDRFIITDKGREYLLRFYNK